MILLTQKPEEGLSVFKVDNTIVIISSATAVDIKQVMLDLVSLSMQSECFGGEGCTAEVIHDINNCDILVCDPSNPNMDALEALLTK